MGLDWIDDLLQKAEGLPLVGGIAHDLRFAYEIMRVDPPDPKTVQPQIDNLAGYHTKASQLLSAYNDGLLTLRQKWTGDVADFYFGPQVTAFQIEHDMEPSTVGAGYQLWNRFSQLTDVLDYNRAAHQSAHDTLVQLVALQSDLETEVTESAVLLAADVEELVPGEEELEAFSIPITVERTGKAVETAQKIEKVGEEVKDIVEVEGEIRRLDWIVQIAKVVGTIGAIVGVTLLPFILISHTTVTNSLPPLSDKKKISQLTDKEFKRMLADLAREFGCSQEEIENILNTYGANNLTPKQLERILRMLQIRAQLQALLDLVRNSGLPGADRLAREIQDELNGRLFTTQDPTTWTDENIAGEQGNLDGFWGAYSSAQQSGGAIDQTFNCGGNRQQVDIVRGDTWIEVKNQSGLSPTSDKFDPLFRQLLNYIRVGQCEGVTNFCVEVPPDADATGLLNKIRGLLTQMGISGVNVDVCTTNFGPPPAPAGGWCTA